MTTNPACRFGLAVVCAVGLSGVGPAADPPAAARAIRVVVLDPQGQPLPDAKVRVGVWTNEKDFKAKRDYQTDAAGAARVELPNTFYILRLWASKRPFVTLFANWEQKELAGGSAVPAEYTMRLEKAVTAGGRVVDELGKPVAGAKVEVSLAGNPKAANGDGRVGYDNWLASGSDAATTDADGRWHVENVPDDPRAELTLKLEHPDFVSDRYWQQTQKTSGVTSAVLRQRTATLTLRRGVSVGGRVTNPAGAAVPAALVVYGDGIGQVRTDADGRYRLPPLTPETTTLAVLAPGWAPQSRRVNLQRATEDFRLGPGRPIRLRFVDAAGQPVPRVAVSFARGNEVGALENLWNVKDTKIPAKADAAGVWEWTWAPAGTVKVEVRAGKFAPVELELTGGGPERTVTLKAEHRLTGRVTDAARDKPIPAFTVVPIDVFRKDWLSADRGNARAGTGGRLDYLADRTDIPLRLRVEAPGYRTQTGPEFRVGDDSSRTQDFRLRPSEPLAGTVVDAAGRPVATARVQLATATETVHFGSSGWNNHTAVTNPAGRFTFPDPGEPWEVFVEADAGFARAAFPADAHDAGILRLRPWAAVRGRLRDGGRPVAGALVLCHPVRLAGPGRPSVQDNTQTVTGPDGRFEFPRVPPGQVAVRVYLGPWKDEGFRSAPSTPLDLKPGEAADLELGGGGATVAGTVKLTGKVPAGLDCNYSINYLVRLEPGIAPPPEIAALGYDARGGWQESWRMGQEGGAFLSTLQSWFVKLTPDGSFRASGVPPGEYDLAVAVYAKPDG